MLAKQPIDTTKVAPPWAANGACPFVGLRPFDYWDHAFFFGRGAYVRQLYRMLDRSRFVAVVGSSGSGKSSLVSAGLRPLLEQESLGRGGREWVWTELRPGDAPLSRLARAIAHVERPAPVSSDPEALTLAHADRLELTLRRSSLGLVQVLSQVRSLHDRTLLLLVDQFEEIFRYANLREEGDSDSFALTERFDEATAFVQLLLEAARDRRLSARIVLAMRADFIGDCGRYLGLAEAVSASQFLVPQLARDELETTIRGPIAKAGASIAPDLVQTLLNDASGDSDQLPVLQHTLIRIWDEAARNELPLTDSPALSETSAGGSAGARHLTMQHYRAIGTFSHALAKHAEEIMSDLPGLEVATEQAFRALAELDRDTHAVRRPLPFDRLLAETGVPEPDLRLVVDRFRRQDCCFLLPTEPTPIASDTIVDVAHEALIRRWDRMGARRGGASEKKGWLWAEADDGNAYRGLLALAGNSASASLPLDQVETRWKWWNSRLRTDAWAARYGGQLGRVHQLFENSRRALKAERDRVEKEEANRRQRMRFAVAAAVVGGILTAAATGGFVYALQQKGRADTAVIETKSGSLWSRLQLWRDPLPAEDVTALWELAREDEKVRVQFVRQLTKDRVLLGRFGRNPMPLARAVGLKWPEEARRAAQQRVEDVATEKVGFKPHDPFELAAYFRAVLAFARLDRSIPDETKKKIDAAIKNLSEQIPDSQSVRALAEITAAVGESVTPEVIIAPETIKAARDSLRDAIVSAKPNEDRFRDMAVSRAIEVMAPDLGPSERSAALGYQLAVLGKQVDTPWAPITPRALLALLPTLKPGEAPDMPKTVLHAVVASAASKSDSSYLLALMQVVEMFGVIPDKAAGATFGQALVEEFAKGDAVPRGALARAAIPLLERRVEGTSRLVAPVAQAIFGGAVSSDIEDQIRQALFSRDPDRKRAASEAVLPALLDEWTTKWPAITAPQKSSELYRRAAQARLIAALAQLLTSASATDAMNAVLLILKQPDIPDYFAGEAMARALEALAPQLPQSVRDGALSPAKSALAGTGSMEEAIAWTRAITALLPNDRDAFTQGVIEILKYPTAAGAPTEVLLAALAERWPDQVTLRGKSLPDKAILDWLEARLPAGRSLSEPPPPPDLHSADPGPEG